VVQPRITYKVVGSPGRWRRASTSSVVIVPWREQMYFVGIDVGKRHHQAVVVDEQGELCGDTVGLSNTRPGIESLVERLEGLDEPVRIALESSGQYWLCLYDQLTSQGYDVAVINPLQINAYRKTGIRKA
jgi:transposase